MNTMILLMLKKLGTDILIDVMRAIIRMLRDRPDTTIGEQSVREVEEIVKRNRK